MLISVTVPTAGLGEAIARHFWRAGHHIIAAGRRADRLDVMVSEFDGDRIYPLPLDVRNRGAVARAISSLPDDYAQVDLLVNNAGLVKGLAPAYEANRDAWDAMVDANTKGLLYVTHAILPGMVARDRGHVINIGSVSGTYPFPGGNVHGATKAFVRQFSVNLRADLHEKRVRVTMSSPG